MKTRDILDRDGVRLPIKIDSTSNGEYEPIPIAKRNQEGNRLALDWATENAKRKGQTRRDFLISSCGAASTFGRQQILSCEFAAQKRKLTQRLVLVFTNYDYRNSHYFLEIFEGIPDRSASLRRTVSDPLRTAYG